MDFIGDRVVSSLQNNVPFLISNNYAKIIREGFSLTCGGLEYPERNVVPV